MGKTIINQMSIQTYMKSEIKKCDKGQFISPAKSYDLHMIYTFDSRESFLAILYQKLRNSVFSQRHGHSQDSFQVLTGSSQTNAYTFMVITSQTISYLSYGCRPKVDCSSLPNKTGIHSWRENGNHIHIIHSKALTPKLKLPPLGVTDGIWMPMLKEMKT